jgi:hypothetical protein
MQTAHQMTKQNRTGIKKYTFKIAMTGKIDNCNKMQNGAKPVIENYLGLQSLHAPFCYKKIMHQHDVLRFYQIWFHRQ